MTGTTTSLARDHGGEVATIPAEARSFFAFLRRPQLPPAVTGFSRAALARVLRLYALDLILMAGLLALASGAIAMGMKMPDNQINSLELTPGVLALIILFAPVMEEIVFRSWLSGRPGALATGAIILLTLLVLFLIPVRSAGLSLSILGAGVLGIALALLRLRGRAQAGWFVRLFPVFFALTSVAFALVHMLNYTEGNLTALLPLVVPQLIAGTIFGYARVVFGFWANTLLHVLHNGTAIGLVLLATKLGGAGA